MIYLPGECYATKQSICQVSDLAFYTAFYAAFDLASDPASYAALAFYSAFYAALVLCDRAIYLPGE